MPLLAANDISGCYPTRVSREHESMFWPFTGLLLRNLDEVEMLWVYSH